MEPTSPVGAVAAASGDGSPSPGSALPPRPEIPALTSGVELLGQQPGSGYRHAPSLARRADGQTIQLTPVLYAVLEAVDGRRSYDEVAAAAGEATGRLISADDARHLAENKLRPLGLLKLSDGSDPPVHKRDPLLGLRFRYVVSDPAVTHRLTAPFAPLFHPLFALVFGAAFVLVSGWVLFEKGLASATHQVFDEPGMMLLVFAITAVSAGFHEFGHAAACRYGGASPGAMGTGLYLVWPAFYTDVSDSYRLGRGGRLRVDVGGLYFNAIVAVAMFGVWALVRWDALLLIIAAQVLQMVRQLAPIVRFDGYHILADLTGVPDLYSRIPPTLAGLLPTNWGRPETKVLRPWARVVVTAWVLVVVPLLLLCLVLIVVTLPRVAGTAWASVGRQWDELGLSWADGDLAAVGVRLLSVVAIALPVLASGYLLVRLTRRTTAVVWNRTRGHPVRRGLAAVAGAAVAASLGWAWWPDGGNYRPIQAYERGTVLDAVPASLVSPSGSGLQEGRTARADQAVWVSPSQLPTPDKPQLALVLVPASEAAPGEAGSGTTASGAPESPAWVFPFAPPGAPGDGDNQALAVNTGDGSTVYDVAFALVWADDGVVTSTNEAYALASCRDCRTVAVGFQVVLVLGQADVVVPQNLSAAVNYSCVQCLTYALAMQLVVTLPSGLSATAMEELTALWEEIAAFGQRIQDVPLDRIQAELAAYQAAILDIIEQDVADAGAPGVPPDVDSTTAPTSTPTASASATGRTTSTPTVPTGVDPTSPSVTSSEPAPSPSQFTQGPSSTETSTPSPTG